MTVKDIEKAILQLPRAEFTELAAWFEELESQLWDEQIERDAKAGRFEPLIAEALAEHKAGRTRPL